MSLHLIIYIDCFAPIHIAVLYLFGLFNINLFVDPFDHLNTFADLSKIIIHKVIFHKIPRVADDF